MSSGDHSSPKEKNRGSNADSSKNFSLGALIEGPVESINLKSISFLGKYVNT